MSWKDRKWESDSGGLDLKTLEVVQLLVTKRSRINVGENMAHSMCRKGLFKVIASNYESRVLNGSPMAVEMITNDNKIHSGDKE